MSKQNGHIFALILICLFLVNAGILTVAADDNSTLQADLSSDGYVCSKEEDAIYATLIQKGYSCAGACGILGNISVENPDFNPDLYGYNGHTYGLFQWTEDGGRQSTLKRWCNNRTLYYNRAEGQLAFAMHELSGGDAIASRINDFLKTTDDPEAAAIAFAVGFERCVGPTGNEQADGVYTGSIYPEFYGYTYQALNKRINNALHYYNKYSAEKVNDSLALEIKEIPNAGIVAEEEELLFKVRRTVNITVKRNLWPFRIGGLILGYLFGNILGAPIIAAFTHRRYMFEPGRKAPSIRNVLNYIGVRESIIAVLIDIAKFYAAFYIMYFISKGALCDELVLWTGLGVVLGNDFPVWRRFRGGMGIIVSTLMICAYMPIWGLCCCLIGMTIGILFKSFEFGALFVSVAAVPYAFICRGTEGGVFILAVMLLVLLLHYRFIKRFTGRKGRRVRHNDRMAAQ